MDKAFFWHVLDYVQTDLTIATKDNAEFTSTQKRMDYYIEQIKKILPPEGQDFVKKFLEEETHYLNCVQAATYTKGLQDGVRFTSFFLTGDIEDKFKKLI